MLFELAASDEARLGALAQAADLASHTNMKGCYPEAEAHWLVAKAHNAACAAHSARRKTHALKLMEAALRLADSTACKGLGAAQCQSVLDQWGHGACGSQQHVDAQ
jgi:hypothetical protein